MRAGGRTHTIVVCPALIERVRPSLQSLHRRAAASGDGGGEGADGAADDVEHLPWRAFIEYVESNGSKSRPKWGSHPDLPALPPFNQN